jgi:hypothetical protein
LFRNLLSSARRQTLIVVVLSMALLASLVPGAALGQTLPDPEILKKLPPLQQPQPADPASVAALGDPKPAEKWEKGKEVVERRTETTKTFMGDTPGHYEDRIYTEPVNFKDGDKWSEIDTDLASPKDGKLKSKANGFDLSLGQQANDPSLANVSVDDQHSVAFGIVGAAKVKGKVSKNAVKYTGVLKNTDVRLTSLKKGVKEEIILTSPDSPDHFVFPLKLKGLTASIDEQGDVVYKDADGKERARTPRGYMFDSSGDPAGGPPAFSAGVTYALIPHGKGTALELRLDQDWLRSQDRKWPITVDPAIYRFVDPDDTFVLSGYDTTNFSAAGALYVGTYNGGANKANSFLHFNTTDLWGKHIDAAFLIGREHYSVNCPNNPEPVYRVLNDTWQASSIAPYPGPEVDTSTGVGGQWLQGTCNNDRYAYWRIDSIVWQWANAGTGHGSLSLRANTYTDNNVFKSYFSSDSGYPMWLQILWSTEGNPFGSLDDAVQYEPGYGNGPATVFARGWMVDPSAPTASIRTDIYTGPVGQNFTNGISMTANWDRPDVGTNYPGYGNAHGYQTTMSTVAGPGNYQICVAGINYSGPGDTTWLPCKTFTITNAPSQPQNVSATPNPDGSVRVNWTPPAATGGAAISGYNVQAFKTDGTYVTYQYACGTCTTVPFGTSSGLVLGTSYKFKVYAQNAAGYSLPGESSVVTPATAPGAPTAVIGTPGPSSALVKWTAPSANGSAITRYDFTATDTASSATTARSCTSGCSPENGFVFDGLLAGRSYTFKLSATNGVGTGAPSQSSNEVTINSSQDYAHGLSATPGDKSVNLQWEAQPLATSYRIRIYLGARPESGVADEAHFVSSTEVGSVTSHTVTGLKNGSRYYFTVTPVVLVLLVGQPSTASNEVMPFGVPFPPKDVQAIPSDGSAIVMWNPPGAQTDTTPGDNGSAITSYRVTTFAAGSSEPLGVVDVAAEPTFTKVSGLENGNAYTFSIQAINAAGPGAAASTTETASPGGRPFAPDNVSASPAGNRSVSLTWSPPGTQADGTPGDNGSPVTGYRVIVSPSCGSCGGTHPGVATATTITGLSAGVTYQFRVVARNRFGEGVPSSPAQSVAIPAEVPGAPSNVVAEWDPNQPLVRVSWAAPESNGSSISSYRVTGQPGSIESTTAATSAEFANLDPAFAYTFVVRASNSVGEGPPSSPSDPAGSPTLPPTSIQITSVKPQDRSAEVKWEDSSGPFRAFGYTVIARQMVGNSVQAVTETPVGPATKAVINLPKGEYVFVVRGSNAAGALESEESQRVAVWNRPEVDQWEFEDILAEFLQVRAQNPYPYSFDSEGCSSPEWVSYLGTLPAAVRAYGDAIFVDACKRHDFGYQNFGRRLHIDREEHIRSAIDTQFLEDMAAICTSRLDAGPCLNVALAYAGLVALLARDGFFEDEDFTWDDSPNNPEQ